MTVYKRLRNGHQLPYKASSNQKVVPRFFGPRASSSFKSMTSAGTFGVVQFTIARANGRKKHIVEHPPASETAGVTA